MEVVPILDIKKFALKLKFSTLDGENTVQYLASKQQGNENKRKYLPCIKATRYSKYKRIYNNHVTLFCNFYTTKQLLHQVHYNFR